MIYEQVQKMDDRLFRLMQEMGLTCDRDEEHGIMGIKLSDSSVSDYPLTTDYSDAWNFDENVIVLVGLVEGLHDRRIDMDMSDDDIKAILSDVIFELRELESVTE